MRKFWFCFLLLLAPAHAQVLDPFVMDAGSGSGPTETIAVTNPGTLVESASYTQAGTYANGPPASLKYSFDSATCGSSASTPTIGGGAYSWTNTAPLTPGSHTITVCDGANIAISGTSAAFTVNAPTPTVTPTSPGPLLASGSYTQAGTYVGYTPAALDYSFNGTGCGSAAGTPTISGGNFSFTATAPAAGTSNTITVCDHSNHTIQNTTSAFYTEAITATNPGNSLTAGEVYSQAATYTGGPATAVDYSYDGTGCGTVGGSPTIGGGNISFTATAPAAGAGHTVSVCDHANHAIVGTSTAFTVNSAQPYPLDVQAGASACYFLAPCSSAIAGAGTQVAISIIRTSDSHRCDITVGGSQGLLASTVSGCSTGGDNGTAVATWCNATTCYASTNVAAPGQALRDQTGNGNDENSQDSGIILTANGFTTDYAFTLAGGGINLIGNGNIQGTNLIGNAFTVVAWVKPTQLNNGSVYVIFGGSSTTPHSNEPEFRVDAQAGNATGKLVLNQAQTANIATSTCTISINAWHSVAVTYDSSGNWAFYADGAACGSGTNLLTLTWGTQIALFFADRSPAAPQFPFIGLTRGFVIYKTAYAAATVEAIMNTGP